MSMNIKQHIEAGHYPKDSKGRALVQFRQHDSGMAEGTAVIVASDKPGKRCLIGWVPTQAIAQALEMAWDENGVADERNVYVSLLPPPPRKVEVRRWAIVRTSDRAVLGSWDTETDAAIARDHSADPDRRRVVMLTGSYEEPWS